MIKQKMTTQYEEIRTDREKEAENLKQYEEAAANEVTKIRGAYDKNKEKVMDLLMASIMNVQLTLPRVVIGNFEEE